MNILKIISMTAGLLVLFINTAQAAQDYNSSRSNRTVGMSVGGETDKLLREASSEASAVAGSMIAIDQKDGYTGEYEVTVNVSVSIKRVAKFKAGKALANAVN